MANLCLYLNPKQVILGITVLACYQKFPYARAQTLAHPLGIIESNEWGCQKVDAIALRLIYTIEHNGRDPRGKVAAAFVFFTTVIKGER